MTVDEIIYEGAAEAASKPKEIAPKGIQKAVCVDVIDLGQVKNIFFDPSKEGSSEYVHQIRIVWELAKRKTSGKPHWISRTFKLSLYDGSRGGNAAALHNILSAWLEGDYKGRFESRAIAGRPAVLVIEHKPKREGDGVQARVASVQPDESGDPLKPSGEYKRYEPKPQGLSAQIQNEEDIPF